MTHRRQGYLQARNQYRDTDLAARIDSATPHALVALMYERLIESLDVLSATIAQGRTIKNSDHSGRASAILVALQTSLDQEKGGALANTLSEIYRAMGARLSRVIAEQDSDLLSELRDGLATVAEAWMQVAIIER
jgi:flagellar secretion chaperone FliS